MAFSNEGNLYQICNSNIGMKVYVNRLTGDVTFRMADGSEINFLPTDIMNVCDAIMKSVRTVESIKLAAVRKQLEKLELH